MGRSDRVLVLPAQRPIALAFSCAVRKTDYSFQQKPRASHFNNVAYYQPTPLILTPISVYRVALRAFIKPLSYPFPVIFMQETQFDFLDAPTPMIVGNSHTAILITYFE